MPVNAGRATRTVGPVAGTVGEAGARRRWQAMEPTLALVVLVLSFAFPFVVVVPSCSEAETKPLSGIDLVIGTDPQFRGPTAYSDEEDARDVVAAVRIPATVALGAAVAGAVVGVLVTVGKGGAGLLRALVGCSLLAVSAVPSVAIAVWVLSDSRLLSGFALAVLAAIASGIVSVSTARALWPPGLRDAGRWTSWRTLILAAGAWALVGLGWMVDQVSGDLANITYGTGLAALAAVAVYAVVRLLWRRPRWTDLAAFALTGWTLSILIALPALAY